MYFLNQKKWINLVSDAGFQILFFFFIISSVFYFINLQGFFGEFYFLTDLAANDFQIMEILKGRLGYGAYSRFQFNHPGPIYFYILAFAERIFVFFESEYSRYVLLTYLLNVICLGVSLYQITKIYKSFLSGLLLFVSFLFVTYSLGFTFFFETWTPYVMVCPFLLYVISVIQVIEKQWNFLPIFLLLGSFIFQLNIMGAVPFGIGFLFLLYHLYQFQKEGDFPDPKKFKFHLAISVLVLVVIWLPVLYDFLVHFPGNISKVIGYLLKGGGSKKPFEVIGFLNPTFGQIFHFPYSLGFYLAIVLAPYWKKLHLDSFSKNLRNFTSLYTVITLLTLFRMKGPIVPHLFWHFFSVIALQLFLLIRSMPWKHIPTKWNLGFVSLLTVLSVVMVLSFGMVPGKERNLYVKEIVSLVQGLDENFVLHWEMNERDFSQGNLVLGVASRLNRNGKKVCFQEPWLFLVPKPYHCSESDTRNATLLLFESSETRFPNLEMVKNEVHYQDTKIKVIKP